MSNVDDHNQKSDAALAQIHYWIREQYFGNALQRMDEFGGREVGEEGDCHWRLLRAFCLIKLGRPSEAMRQLNAMLKDNAQADFKLAILHGLRVAHSAEANIGLKGKISFLMNFLDREAIRELDRQIQSLWLQCPEQGAFSAATLLLLDGQFERARPLMEKLSSQSNSLVCASKVQYPSILTVLGFAWLAGLAVGQRSPNGVGKL